MVAYALFEGLMGQKIRKNREEKKLDSVKDNPEEYQLMKEKFEQVCYNITKTMHARMNGRS